VQSSQRASAGAPRFSEWLGRMGCFWPSTIQTFFIFFFRETLEICRKLQKIHKIVKPIFLGLLFSLEFNKNSFMIFRLNKEF
jgi:hypothetical protein